MRVAVDQRRHQKLALRVDDFLGCAELPSLLRRPDYRRWLPTQPARFRDLPDGAVGKNLHRAGIQHAVGGIESEHASVANDHNASVIIFPEETNTAARGIPFT